MKRVKWDLEEAIALFDLFMRYGGNLTRIPSSEIDKLTNAYIKRAEMLGIVHDEKYRNHSGLSMQLGCIKYVVTDGKEGFSAASKLFYETFDLYINNRAEFDSILRDFKEKYSLSSN